MASNPDYHKTGIKLDLPDFSKELETLNDTKQKFRDICIKYKQESITATTPFNKYPDVINGLIAGGGIQPTEDITVTSNGTYSVIGLRNAIINVPTSVESSVFAKMIDNSFSSTDALALPDGITSVRDYAFYKLSNLKAIDLANCTSIGQYAFQESGVTNLTIPSTVTSVSTYALANNTNLKTLTLANNSFSSYECTGDSNLETVSVNTTTTTIPSYMFRNCTKLKSFPFEKFTRFNTYSFNNAGSSNSAEDALDLTVPSGAYFENYAFDGANLKNININFNNNYLSNYTFRNTKNVESVEIRNWKSVNQNSSSYAYYMFDGCGAKSIEMNSIASYYSPYMLYNMTKIEKTSGITPAGTIWYGAFQNMGNSRANTSKQLKIDMSKGTATTIMYYAFANLKNTEVTLPSTITTMTSYTSSKGPFDACSDLCVVLNSVPSIEQYTFSNNTNLKIFTPYTNIEELKGKTNWSYYADNIFGYIDATPETTELPEYYDTEKTIDLAWHTGTDFSTAVETIEPGTRYFCEFGPFYLTKLIGVNTEITISDDTGKTYVSGDRIITGTDLTIALTPNEDTPIVYMCTVNGESMTPVDNKLTIKMGDRLEVKASYWDGENPPFDPTFADNTWAVIALGISTRKGFEVGWKIGDTKTVTTTEGYTFTIRLCDTQAGRYTLADGSGSTNAVLEFVEGYPKISALNNSPKDGYWTGGGWAVCDMNTAANNLGTIGSQYGVLALNYFLSTLPEDLQAIIPSVSLSGYSRTSPSPRTGTSKLFLPSGYEVWNSSQRPFYVSILDKNANVGDDYQQFDLYKEKGAAAMQKYRLGSTSSDWFWLRSPYYSSYYTFGVWRGASAVYWDANYSCGVAPVFAL